MKVVENRIIKVYINKKFPAVRVKVFEKDMFEKQQIAYKILELGPNYILSFCNCSKPCKDNEYNIIIEIENYL